MLAAAESPLHDPHLLIGDWNTGAHRLDDTGETFVCAELRPVAAPPRHQRWYSHIERDAGVTDHSMVIVEVE